MFLSKVIYIHYEVSLCAFEILQVREFQKKKGEILKSVFEGFKD